MDALEQRAAFERVIRDIAADAKLLSVRRLEGGVSAEVTALEIETAAGATRKLVVRRHGVRDLTGNPHVAAHEFSLLKALHAKGLAVPAPIHVDESGTVLASPFCVIAFVEGEIVDAPRDLGAFLDQMAGFLAELHRVDADDPSLAFLGDNEAYVTAKLAARREGRGDDMQANRIRHLLQASWPPPACNRPTVLHGDYWSGNVLWRDGKLAAVIDWEDASRGDPVADLANIRLELLWSFGSDAMESFTRSYLGQAGTDPAALAHWDLWAALRPASTFANWGLDPATARDMRDKHRMFVEHAVEALGAG
jgi:aminoglycoside phosphotransferase (APT) family kinase protein